ncbi:maleylacetoacetate isomerase [Sphingomonas sp.]|uniref:maleylacetoacetate isomerase n=1 Tax=Sphingomonas sp. TaxID=28214 RepID=UPI002BEA35EF|nr:maleylacetoacetate isomerase [Sphingomonas sp.]HWK36302.1 maleylacetoacetate isomerase [Sphingomonas sp.]
MILHDYWRSSAAYRVRIGLNLKGLAYTSVSHDLTMNEQRDPAYLAKAPQGLVPALEVGGRVLVQSVAILEWLDETYPNPPFLPVDADGRAAVRAMALVIAADIHPVNNLRIANALRSDFGADGATVVAWMQRWMTAGFDALEAMVARDGGDFSYGDAPGLADILLVPQWYNAERYRLDTTPWPRLAAVVDRARALPAFAAAAPERQREAD